VTRTQVLIAGLYENRWFGEDPVSYVDEQVGNFLFKGDIIPTRRLSRKESHRKGAPARRKNLRAIKFGGSAARLAIHGRCGGSGGTTKGAVVAIFSDPF